MLRHAILLALLAFAPRYAPAAAEPVSVPTAQVTLADLDDEDQYYIHGVFEMEVPGAQVWAVLSDYEGLKGVVSSLRSSKVLERKAEMLVLAGLVRLPLAVVVGFGGLLIAGHNLLDPVRAAQLGAWGPLWKLLHESGVYRINPQHLVIIGYPLVPWCGGMSG
jgi:hypothetical protein